MCDHACAHARLDDVIDYLPQKNLSRSVNLKQIIKLQRPYDHLATLLTATL